MLHYNFLLTILCTLFIDSFVSSFSQEGGDDGKKGQQDDGIFNDYQIYTALDSAQKLFKVNSFYDLLGITESQSLDDDLVKEKARPLSFKYHPDKLKNKTPEERADGESRYKIIRFAAGIFKDERGRKRYEWIRNEAPPWHKQSVYLAVAMRRKRERGGKGSLDNLTIKQVVLMILISGIVMEYLLLWTLWIKEWWLRRIWANREIKKMGEKEIKRLRKKLEEITDEKKNTISLKQHHENNSPLLIVALSNDPLPILPSIFDLTLFRFVRYFLIHLPLSLMKRKRENGMEENRKFASEKETHLHDK